MSAFDPLLQLIQGIAYPVALSEINCNSGSNALIILVCIDASVADSALTTTPDHKGAVATGIKDIMGGLTSFLCSFLINFLKSYVFVFMLTLPYFNFIQQLQQIPVATSLTNVNT